MARHSTEKCMSVFHFSPKVAARPITFEFATERSDREYLGRPVARHSAQKCMSVFILSLPFIILQSTVIVRERTVYSTSKYRYST